MHEKRATLIVWKAERNKVHGVPKVHRTKIAEELGIRVKKVTEKTLSFCWVFRPAFTVNS